LGYDSATGFPVRSHHLSGQRRGTAVKGELLHHNQRFNYTAKVAQLSTGLGCIPAAERFRVYTEGQRPFLTRFMNLPFYGQAQCWQVNSAVKWILVALTGAGFLFVWWARIHLGRFWSDWLTKKTGHHVVDTGPYRLVRHPIYSGLILASFTTAIEKGTSFALLGQLLEPSPSIRKRDGRKGSCDLNSAKVPMTRMHARLQCWCHLRCGCGVETLPTPEVPASARAPMRQLQ